MRLNYIGGASATGGTGALTLTATEGLALPSAGFISGQAMDYSIVEYTDATKTTIAKAETGIGTVVGAVLTRAVPRTTWDGTTYLQASPSALSFGTANVRIYCAPSAESGATSFARRVDLSANYGINGYVIGANVTQQTDLSISTLLANRQHAVPLKLEAGFPLTQIGIQVTAGAAGTTVNCAIASVNPTTGFVGQILAAANGLDSSASGFVMGSITSRLFPPGWYWQIFNSDGGPTIRASEQFIPGPLGAFSSGGSRIHRGNFRNRTFADYTVGADGMAGTSGSYGGADNIGHPIILMR